MQNHKAVRYLRISEVCERLGVHPCTVYRHAGKDGFPELVELFPGVSAIKETDLDAYLASRPLRKDNPSKSVQRAIRARREKRGRS